jgi:hypothetical protein
VHKDIKNNQNNLPSNPTNTDLYFTLRDDIFRINNNLTQRINDLEHKHNQIYTELLWKIIASIIMVVGTAHGLPYVADVIRSVL